MLLSSNNGDNNDRCTLKFKVKLKSLCHKCLLSKLVGFSLTFDFYVSAVAFLLSAFTPKIEKEENGWAVLKSFLIFVFFTLLEARYRSKTLLTQTALKPPPPPQPPSPPSSK